MTRDERARRAATVAPFVPAGALVVGVVLSMHTTASGTLGLAAILVAFAGGLTLAVGSVPFLLVPERLAGTSIAGRAFLAGLSLAVSAALLYPRDGRVFGCPGRVGTPTPAESGRRPRQARVVRLRRT